MNHKMINWRSDGIQIGKGKGRHSTKVGVEIAKDYLHEINSIKK